MLICQCVQLKTCRKIYPQGNEGKCKQSLLTQKTDSQTLTEKKKPSMQLLVERTDHVWALLENASWLLLLDCVDGSEPCRPVQLLLSITEMPIADPSHNLLVALLILLLQCRLFFQCGGTPRQQKLVQQAQHCGNKKKLDDHQLQTSKQLMTTTR